MKRLTVLYLPPLKFFEIGALVFSLAFLFSCKTAPVTVPVRVPEAIMGSGHLSSRQLVSFFCMQEPNADREKIARIAALYTEEAAFEGVNADIAFAQMCLETGFLRFGGVVTEDMNNFCGLGSVNDKTPGHTFADERTGIRAHIQHLKAYATPEPLHQDCVDPRYRYVNPRGKSADIHGLSGTWAADPLYGKKLAHILLRMYTNR